MVELMHNYAANYAASAENGNWALMLCLAIYMQRCSCIMTQKNHLPSPLV